MHSEFSRYKKAILIYLEQFFKEKSKEFQAVTIWGKDVCDRLLESMSQGKMLRGSLLFTSYTLFSNKDSEDVIRAAAAIELLHSSLITHDDIMDRDTVRRGKPTIWKQYSDELLATNPSHFGQSMAICFGDIGFFLAYELLSKMQTKEITTLFSKELSYVVLAQMQDVYNGVSAEEPTEEEIITLYTYKTGRYTFSLPLMTGAMLAKQNQTIIASLEKIGELLGILFQLKDDELGLFGDENETGKPLGSDIRENKKTIYRLFLYQKLSYEEKNIHDVTRIYDLYIKYNIQQEVKNYMNDIERKVNEEIALLSLNTEQKKLLNELLAFSVQRKK